MSGIIAKKFYELEKKYSKKQSAIRFNFRKFVSTNLHIKRSDVFTHNIHSYPGRLFPYIPIFFLSSDKFCPANGRVLDTFSGSGTVLLESIVNPYFKRDVYGVEINPLGRLISKVKTTPINPIDLDNKIDYLFKIIKKTRQNSKLNSSIPEFKNIDLWFSKNAKSGLGKIKACIEQLEDGDCKDFFWVCFSKLVRSVSRADPNIPPPVLLKVKKYKNSYRYEKLKDLINRNENPDVEGIFKEIVQDNSERIKHLWEVKEVREREVAAKIIWDNSRKIRGGCYTFKGVIDKKKARKMNNSISMIITSPPYLSAQKYVRSTKLELYWLGMANEVELNELDRETIGTERVSLKNEKQDIGIVAIDKLLKRAEKISKERMLAIYEYFKNMALVFKQSYNLLKANGLMVLVVGNNKVGDSTVNTSQLLIDLAKKTGFEENLVLRDEIKGRGMITKRHGTGGLIKDEFVIVLQKIK
jgi:DNA modification methylase